MNRSSGLLTVVAVVLALGCSGSKDEPADAGGALPDGAAACGGASASVFAGACTYTASGLTTCAEDYYSHALTSTEVEVQKKACSGSGFTYSTTEPCPTASVACKCVDTTGLFKRIKYGYGTYADACGTCTGACYSKQ
jgi:hypothetical protein